MCEPDRARAIFDELSTALQRECGIGINLGKTRVWNAGGLTPMGFEGMGSPEQPVWVGDQSLPPEQQGLVVLGTPHGHRAYVTRHLEDLSAEHQRLLDVLHELPELQSSWLLLSLCASPRCNYYLRALPPASQRLSLYGTTWLFEIACCGSSTTRQRSRQHSLGRARSPNCLSSTGGSVYAARPG